MITFKDIRLGAYGPYNFKVPRGSSAALITGSASESAAVTSLIAGLERPDSGEVIIDGQSIYNISEAELFALLKNVGIVWRHGGIISNLKVWENILLPASYHNGTKAEEADSIVLDVCSALGIKEPSEFMSSSPSALVERDKLVVGIIRAMLLSPELLVYDSVLKLSPAGYYKTLADLLMGFHKTGQGDRTSVFISASRKVLSTVEADITINTRLD